MIPARKFALGHRLVQLLIDSSFRKYFDHIYFYAQTQLTEEQRRLPLIICANHSTWWDGYVALLLERQLRYSAYLMMEEAQLRRYSFFTWAGCFSVDRQNVRSALQSLQYASKILKERPRRFVWLFPQGEIEPNDRRPLTFFNGAAYLARAVSPAIVLPIAIRIEFQMEQRPSLFIRQGEPLEISTEEAHSPQFLKNCTHQLEHLVTDQLDQLKTEFINQETGKYVSLMRGRTSTNKIFDRALLRSDKGQKKR